MSCAESDLYHDIISILNDIRLVDGPMAVSSTLRRHPVVADFLKSYQKSNFSYLEHQTNLLTSDE